MSVPRNSQRRQIYKTRNVQILQGVIGNIEYVEDYETPLNKFEMSMVIAKRAEDISNNYKPFITFPGIEKVTSVQIAEYELQHAETSKNVRNMLNYILVERNEVKTVKIYLKDLEPYSSKESYVNVSFDQNLYQPLNTREFNNMVIKRQKDILKSKKTNSRTKAKVKAMIELKNYKYKNEVKEEYIKMFDDYFITRKYNAKVKIPAGKIIEDKIKRNKY